MAPYQTAAQIRTAIEDLGSTAKFTDAMLSQLVASFERIASDYCGVAFDARTTIESLTIPRYGQVSAMLGWPKVRSITSVTVAFLTGDTAQTTLVATDYAFDPDIGTIMYPAGFAADSRVVVTYSHGFGYRTLADGVTTSGSATVTSATGLFTSSDIGTPITGIGIPAGSLVASVNSATSIVITELATATGTGIVFTLADPLLVDACRQYVRATALASRSGVPRDVISQNIEGITTRFSTPDKHARRPTGYLDVDRLLNSLPNYRHPAVA